MWFQNVVDEPTGIDPVAFANRLDDNYPNPFNPTTTIRYSIASAGHVSLKIYNAAGQLVRTLVDEDQAPRRRWVLGHVGRRGNAGETRRERCVLLSAHGEGLFADQEDGPFEVGAFSLWLDRGAAPPPPRRQSSERFVSEPIPGGRSMRTIATLFSCLLFVLASAFGAAEAKKISPKTPATRSWMRPCSRRPRRSSTSSLSRRPRRTRRSSAGGSSTDPTGFVDPQGWTAHDLTGNDLPVLPRRRDRRAVSRRSHRITGAKSMWCGQWATSRRTVVLVGDAPRIREQLGPVTRVYDTGCVALPSRSSGRRNRGTTSPTSSGGTRSRPLGWPSRTRTVVRVHSTGSAVPSTETLTSPVRMRRRCASASSRTERIATKTGFETAQGAVTRG